MPVIIRPKTPKIPPSEPASLQEVGLGSNYSDPNVEPKIEPGRGPDGRILPGVKKGTKRGKYKKKSDSPHYEIPASRFQNKNRKAPLNPKALSVTRYKELFVSSKIPGFEPEKVTNAGRCVYSKEQLEEARKQLPALIGDVAPSFERYANREQEVAQVELLLLKGVSNTTTISGLLGLSRTHVHGLISAVESRWAVLGGPRNSDKIKGEAASKLSMIEKEYWDLFESDKTPATLKVSILANLINVLDRKLILHGLSPRVLEATAQEKAMEGDLSPNPVLAAVEIRDSLAEATREAVQLIAQAGKVYENEVD